MKKIAMLLVAFVMTLSANAQFEQGKYYVGASKKLGIKCVVWDNGSLSGSGSFGIYSRTDNKWNSAILKGIMDGANS